MLVLIVFDRVRSNGQMGVVERSSIELRNALISRRSGYPRTNGARHQRCLCSWRLLKVNHS